ncbi:MAG: hypothetical protein AVDCRST_MAG93-3737 [uncultured Chloroflexia bacterium]|uniref:Uncharacterized protein n=1 Tax=uncultured Chloroflexia bacterium TaxID=1672391 RepID=A0A6J4JVP2_9CHLR|nr:MAG: hypothetical protein AVDCRST_MAG93-3737 [uncultured Chloroflexia bacterium]
MGVHIQQYYSKCLKSGRQDGRQGGLSPQTGDSDEGEQRFRDDTEHPIRSETEHVRSAATLALRLSEKCSASSSPDIRSEAEVGGH